MRAAKALVAGSVLAAGLLGWWPAGQAGGQDASQVSVRAGPRWGGSSRGSWTPYQVVVRNDGPRDLHGEVLLVPSTTPATPPDPPAPAEQPPGDGVLALGETEMTVLRGPGAVRSPADFPAYRTPLSLAGQGGEKSLTVLVVEAPDGYRAEVRDGSGRTVATAEEPPPAPGTVRDTVALLSSAPGAAGSLGALADFFASGRGVLTLVPSARDLPSSALLLGGLQALVVAGFDVASLGDEQVRAVQDYVAFGGSLVLVGGAAVPQGSRSLPEALVPLRPDASALASMSPLADLVGGTTAASAAVVTGELRRGRALLGTPGGPPLVVQAEYGAGRVVQLAFDPLEEPLASDPFLRHLAWYQGISRALDRFEPGAGPARPAPPEQLWSGIFEPEEWPRMPEPLLWLLAAYGALAVPLGYALARSGRRPHAAWVALPLGAVLLAGLVVVAGASPYHPRGPALEVRALGPGGEALVTTYRSVGSGRRGADAVDRTRSRAVSTAFASPALVGDPSRADVARARPRRPGVVEYGESGTTTVLPPGGPDDRHGVQAVSLAHGPGIESHLRLESDGPPERGGLRIVGTVANHTSRRLARPRAQLPEGAQAVLAEALPPGRTLAVDARFVWPRGIRAGSGVPGAPEDRVLFAAADASFDRAGRVAVVALDGTDRQTVVVQVVALEAGRSVVAGTGGPVRVASLLQPQGSRVSAWDLVALPGIGPLDLRYNIYAGPPEVYDWTTGTWRRAPRQDPSVFEGPATLLDSEVHDGVVRIRGSGDSTGGAYDLAPRRP